MGRIIGIVAAKGGVGKTTVAANLGVILAKHFNKKTLVIDSNITAACMGLNLGMINPPTTIEDVLKRKMLLEKTVYIHESGLNVIPASLYSTSLPKLDKFVHKVAPIHTNYDFMILDSAPCMNKETMLVLGTAHDVLLVTTPDFPSVAMTMKAAKMAREMGKTIIGVVVNKRGAGNKELNIEEIEKAIGEPVIGMIPFDRRVRDALYHQTPVCLYSPYSKASSSMRKIAEYITDETPRLSLLEELRMKLGV